MSSESFMGSVTANQVIDPKYASNQSPTDPQKTIGRHPCTYVLIAIIVVLLIFPIVTIPILFSLYGRKSTDSTSTSSMGTTLSAISSTSVAAGVAVSLSATGQIQKGGGTSIYRGVGAVPTDLCPKFLSGTPIFDNKYLISFRSSVTGTGSMSVMDVDVAKKSSVVLNSAYSIMDLYHVVTLDQAGGTFVTISQDDSFVAADTAVIAGKVDKTSYAVTFGAPVAYANPKQFSIDPSIVALSSTTFAIAYYGGTPAAAYPLTCLTRFGVVNPNTLVVTLSAPFSFADDAKYDTSFTLSAISAYQYLVVYYIGSAENVSNSDPSISTVIMNAAKFPANETIYVKPFGVVSKLPGSIPTGVIRATTMDSNTFVIAYSDMTNNYAVTCLLVEANLVSGVINFISTLQITTGFSVKYISSGTVNINLVTITAGSQFMVMFSDLGLDGAIVAAIGTTAGSALVRGSPNFILNSGIATKNTIHSFISLAVAKSTPYGSSIAILSSLTDTKCLIKPITDFSVMEIMPKPIGITHHAMDSSTVSSIAVEGLVDGYTGLVTGQTYYATTMGTLVTSGKGYGRDPTTASSASMDDYFYIEDKVNGVIVSADSQIGIALSSTSLLLRSN